MKSELNRISKLETYGVDTDSLAHLCIFMGGNETYNAALFVIGSIIIYLTNTKLQKNRR